MSDPVNHILKLLDVKPDGALSLRTGVVGGNLAVQIVCRGVVVGVQYLVAANDGRNVEAQDGI